MLFERLGHKGSRIERAFSVPWTEANILEVFGDCPAESKDAQQLFGAARYKEGHRRGNAGINSVCAAVLDCDCADVGELDRISSSIAAQGLAFIAYTAWSHRRPEKKAETGKTGPFDSFRIIIPYSRELSPAEHSALLPALFGREVPADPAHYAEEARGVLVTTPSGKQRASKPRGWDPVCSRPAQAYYVPSVYSSVDVYTGRALDVDAILARPTTARPSIRTERQFFAPDLDGIHALARVVSELSKTRDIEAPQYQGWQRAACPSCAPGGSQRSPSFTVRANGNGVDLHCHAGCTRSEILSALSLRSDGIFAAPSSLRLMLDEQLSVQTPRSDAVPVDVAAAKLVVDIREAVVDRKPAIIQYGAGVGKSFASAIVMTEHARNGYKIAYATQEHVVAGETRNLLPPDVKARSVHIHSALIQVGTDPVCQRADELKERVFEFGVSLLGSICPKCQFRETCAAKAAATERAKLIEEASVVFVSHAGIGQLFGEGKGHDLQLIVDEMPGTYKQVSVSRHDLKLLARGTRMSCADASIEKVVGVIARAWIVGLKPGLVSWHHATQPMGDAAALALEWGRLRLRDGCVPTAAERPLLKAADSVIRLCAWQAQGGTLMGLGRGEQGDIAAMLPDAAHEALVDRGGVLLSATPLMPALPGFKLRECEVLDGAKVTRKMVLRSGRGSGALTSSYYDDRTGVRRRREREPGERPGIPWPVIDEALERAHIEAEKYDCKRVLFVSFKSVIDALRSRGGYRVNNTELAHYGALRGKNDWQEKAAKECSVVYLLGAPRFAVMPTLIQLGLNGQAADQAWVAYAAGELTQAEGRLRLPRRTKPCTIFVEGDVAPSTWHAENLDEVITTGTIETASSLLEAALLWYTQEELAEALGALYRHGQPGDVPPAPEHTPSLRRLSRPDFSEAIGILADMPPERRKTHEELFSWVDE